VIVTVQQPGADYAWLADCPRILDCTYSLQPVDGQDLYAV